MFTAPTCFFPLLHKVRGGRLPACKLHPSSGLLCLLEWWLRRRRRGALVLGQGYPPNILRHQGRRSVSCAPPAAEWG